MCAGLLRRLADVQVWVSVCRNDVEGDLLCRLWACHLDVVVLVEALADKAAARHTLLEAHPRESNGNERYVCHKKQHPRTR